jgi:hypothetical protein
MNSGNHVMLLGDLVIWLFEDLAGIRPDPIRPGSGRFILRPEPAGDLTAVQASTRAPAGEVRSSWKTGAGRFSWEFTLPPNAGATVYVPANGEASVSEGGRRASKSPGLHFLRMEKDRAVYEAESGTYRLTVEPFAPKPAPPPPLVPPVLTPADTAVAVPSRVLIRIAPPPDGVQIRYTLDGSDPTEKSSAYTGPFETDRTVTVTARAFKAGAEPSAVRRTVVDVYDRSANGLQAAVYLGEWTMLPDFGGLRPRTVAAAFGFDPGPLAPRKDGFGIVFKAALRVPADGDYRFFISSDDGSRLLIDGRLVAENDSVHDVSERTGSARLSSGRHALEVQYFEATGGEALALEIEGPGLPRQPLPMSLLFRR